MYWVSQKKGDLYLELILGGKMAYYKKEESKENRIHLKFNFTNQKVFQPVYTSV